MTFDPSEGVSAATGNTPCQHQAVAGLAGMTETLPQDHGLLPGRVDEGQTADSRAS